MHFQRQNMDPQQTDLLGFLEEDDEEEFDDSEDEEESDSDHEF